MTTKSIVTIALVFLGVASVMYCSVPSSTTPARRDPAANVPAKLSSSEQRRRCAGVTADAPDTPADATANGATDAERAKWPIRVTTNVPGARVSMRTRVCGGDPDPPEETKTADARGFAGFDVPSTGAELLRLEFVARADGWATREMTAVPGDVRIVMRRGVVVRGRLVDGAGAGVRNAWLHGKFVDQVSVLASADGTFEASFRTAGPVSFQVTHPAFLPRDVEATAPAQSVVVVLERGLEVSGRVAFPDGRPLPGALVRGELFEHLATTGDDGRYVLSGLASGPVTVDCPILGDETRTVDGGATGVDFLVSIPVARVHLLDARGRPFRFASPHIRVRKGDQDVYYDSGVSGLDDDGVHLVPGTPGARLIVAASGGPLYGGATLDFDDSPRLVDVDVVLGAAKPTGTIRLVVRCDSGDTPRGVYATVEDEFGNTTAGGPRVRFALDAAGSVEIPNVPAGRATATVTAAAWLSAEYLRTPLVTAHPSTVVQAGRSVDVVATLVPARLQMRVASIVPFDGMFVRSLPEGGWTYEFDASPAILLEARPPGRYVVHATTADGVDVDQEVEVRRGETTDVELTAKSKQ